MKNAFVAFKLSHDNVYLDSLEFSLVPVRLESESGQEQIYFTSRAAAQHYLDISELAGDFVVLEVLTKL